MVTIGVVLLSRYDSSRLPGKALIQIKGKPVLLHIIERLLTVVAQQDLLIATSTEGSDDVIVDFAKTVGVECFRGSLNNVAERFYDAATSKKWDYAVRINGDNLFVDTDLLSKMIAAAKENIFDFLSNVKGRTFPKGMSIEIIRLSFFQKFKLEIYASDEYREHVLYYFYGLVEREIVKHRYFYNTSLPDMAGVQLALDTQDDLLFAKKIISHFENDHEVYNMEKIASIIKEHKIVL